MLKDDPKSFLNTPTFSLSLPRAASNRFTIVDLLNIAGVV
jgi:hypothetical protein